MTTARIYRPSKTAMQSGRARADLWVLEYESEKPKRPESLMGWTSSGDTLEQVSLKFGSLEEAQAFAQSKGLAYSVERPRERKLKARNYVDNFKYVPPPQDPKKKSS
jgi:hypothetical protein